jgi:hypothetical protein
LTAFGDLFVCAKDLFDGANGETRRALSAASLLADQQEKHSGTYQQRNQNTNDERGNPTLTLDGFRSSTFLRRSETQPEEKSVHSGQPSSALLCGGLTMLTTTVNFSAR